jgi:hypothetical protein
LRAASDEEPDAQWRKAPAYLQGRTLGSPVWQTVWPLTPAAGLAEPTRSNSPLKDVLEKIEAARPPRSVGLIAGSTATKLATQRKELVTLPDAGAVNAARKWTDSTPTVPEWDSGSQLLFGAAALERSRRAKPDALTTEFRTAFVAFLPPRVPHTDEDARRKDEAERWKKFHAALDTIRTVQKNRP